MHSSRLNTVAIVTGASRGIGRATAIRLAEDHHALVLAARSTADLEDTANAVQAAGAQALPVACDLRDPAAAAHLIEAALSRFHRLDALVNIAGAVPQTDLFQMSDAEWTDGLALKFHGARRLTLAAWNALRETGGSVIFTSGTSALAPKASLAAVGSINAAIVALSKAFAERGKSEGIQVNSILPGPVMTQRRRSMLERYAAAHHLTTPQAVDQFAHESGITRYGTPQDIASLIAFLLSPAARWLTGSALRMDGGELQVP